MVSLILTCAGSGKRTGFDENKLLKLINGKSVIDTAFDAFFDSGLIDEFIITANKFDYDFLTKKFDKRANVVLGGETRTLSTQVGVCYACFSASFSISSMNRAMAGL